MFPTSPSVESVHRYWCFCALLQCTLGRHWLCTTVILQRWELWKGWVLQGLLGRSWVGLNKSLKTLWCLEDFRLECIVSYLCISADVVRRSICAYKLGLIHLLCVSVEIKRRLLLTDACITNNLYLRHLADVLMKSDLQSALVLCVYVMSVRILIKDKRASLKAYSTC